MKIQKFYFAVLGSVAGYLAESDKRLAKEITDQLHEELKVANNIRTTSNLDGDGRYRYITLSLLLINIAFGLYFDSDGYKYENVKYTVIGKGQVFIY